MPCSFQLRELLCGLGICLSVIPLCAKAEPCQSSTTLYGTVCVCTSHYCDSVAPMPHLSASQVAIYQTVKPSLQSQGSFLNREPSITLSATPQPAIQNITVFPNQMHQKIIGFGGALSDATILNISKMSASIQDKISEAYFAKIGLAYDIVRIPIGSTDFSTNVYSYDDAPKGNPHYQDMNLEHFKLNSMDTHLKIPYLLKAEAIAKQPIYLFASPWSAPSWMKINEIQPMVGGYLNPDPAYYRTWTLYFVKFLNAYAAYGIHFWAVTIQNEPHDQLGLFQSMEWTAGQEATFIGQYLGPVLKESHPNVNILIHDDAISFLPNDAKTILDTPGVKQYVSGIGIHWYFAPTDKTQRLDETHQNFPEQILFGTEASIGFMPPDNGPKPGDWSRGEEYGQDIIEDLNHHVSGWTDWNMVLNMQGGPNWAKTFTDAPILVDPQKHVFYKQPMYYYLGQFSHFIPHNSFVIGSQSQGVFPLQVTAALTPEQNIVIVVMNKDSFAKTFSMHVQGRGYINNQIPAHAIQTYVLPLKRSSDIP